MKQKPTPKAVKAKPAEFIFKPNWWLAAVCGVIGFLLYANTIPNRYALDDIMVITKNKFITEGFKGIHSLFSIDVWHFGNVTLGYYRPLSLVTFAIENQFFPLNPNVEHVGNVLLYAITGFFVCVLLMQIFRKYNPVFPFIVTLLFLAHPIHTEVVANIKSRDEMLAFLNIIISISAFLYAVQSSRWAFYLVSGFFFYLGLLSKETALTGIIMLPVILFFSTQLSLKQIALRTLPFLGLIALFQVQKFWALGTLSGITLNDAVNYPYAMFNAKLPSSFMIFLWCNKLITFPYPLSYNYAFNQLPPTNWTSAETWAGILMAAGVLYLLYRNFNQKTPFNLGLLLWGIALAPSMGFVLLKGGILAERMLYAPALGFSIILVWLLAKITGTNLQSGEMKLPAFLGRVGFSIPLVGIFILYSAETFSRNPVWYDDISLYNHDVEVAPNSTQTHLHLAFITMEQGNNEKDPVKKQEYYQKSLAQFRISLLIDNFNPEANYGIASVYVNAGQNLDSAVIYCKRSIEESPNYPKSYACMALAYENLDKHALASYYYNKAVELNPYDDEVLNNRAKHIHNTGYNLTVMPTDETNSSDAADKEYLENKKMGFDYGQKGDFENALKCMKRAVELKPTSAEALVNLAICYGMMNDYKDNIETLTKMLSLYPNSIIGLQNMVITYQRLGDKGKVAEYQKKIDALNGGNAGVPAKN